MSPNRLPTVFRAATGVLAALAVLELALRAFVTPARPPTPAIRRDALDAPVVVARQIEEGIGVARFSTTGARLTGNSAIAGAETLVLLGDSFVAAREVADSRTMGAQLERIARDAGRPLNVRQYGWRGASPAQYLLVAREVLERWKPAHVVVVLSNDDLDDRPLAGQYPRLHLRADGAVEVVRSAAAVDDAERGLVHRSSLAFLLRHRWQQIADRSPRRVRALLGGTTHHWNPVDSSQVAMVPSAVVRSLSAAYGDRLTIVYAADVRVNGGDTTDPLEGALLTQCAVRRVRCVSARATMLEARRLGLVARGFPTTTLGVGHLNDVGHWVMAETIWRTIRVDASRSATVARR